jgi:TfoX/Sxy family transcriptional regulator of competence genes
MHHGGNWEKAPADLIDRFTGAVGSLPGATVRKMFGYPAAFTNGHLFTGLFAASWFVRLPDADLSELTAVGGTPFEPMAGRPMRGYLVLPPAIAGDADAAEPWVTRALAHVQQLPPKAKR